MHAYRKEIEAVCTPCDGGSSGFDLAAIVREEFGHGATHSVRVGGTLHMLRCNGPDHVAVAHFRWASVVMWFYYLRNA